MNDRGVRAKRSAAAIVLEIFLVLFISVGMYIQYIEIESVVGFATVEYGTSLVLGLLVGVVLAYGNTIFETVDVRYGFLIILFTLVLGLILFPNGLPTTVLVGVLGALWGSIGVRIALIHPVWGND